MDKWKNTGWKSLIARAVQGALRLFLDEHRLLVWVRHALTLMERKSRMPQIQGVQRRSRSNLLRAFGNAGDGVSPAFPKGKQNREKKGPI